MHSHTHTQWRYRLCRFFSNLFMADANRILFETPPELCRIPPGWPRSTWLKNINDDLTSFDMELVEARDAAQNWPFWRMLASYSTMSPEWCMLILYLMWLIDVSWMMYRLLVTVLLVLRRIGSVRVELLISSFCSVLPLLVCSSSTDSSPALLLCLR